MESLLEKNMSITAIIIVIVAAIIAVIGILWILGKAFADPRSIGHDRISEFLGDRVALPGAILGWLLLVMGMAVFAILKLQ